MSATDCWGKESAPSRAIKVKKDKLEQVIISLEAEDGDLAGAMARGKGDAASGRSLVHRPLHNGEPEGWKRKSTAVLLRFRIPAQSRYLTSARAFGLAKNADSFVVSLDRGEKVGWVSGRPYNQWNWTNLSPQLSAGLSAVRLTSGEHTIQIYAREDAARLDKIVLTNDPFVDAEMPVE